jgi:hypothetical protein
MTVKRLALALVLVTGTTLMVLAQPQPQDPQADPDVPITGIEYLLIGGGAYGISRLLKRKGKDGGGI